MKLTDSQVVEIFISNLSTQYLADKYGVSTNTVRAIKRRKAHPDITGQYHLLPGVAKSNRHILDDQTVREIFLSTGSIRWFKQKYNVSKNVVMNIKFRHTYFGVTEDLRTPGEIKIHSLTWDDVCTIRVSKLTTATLAELFGVCTSTINNIRVGRTRRFK